MAYEIDGKGNILIHTFTVTSDSYEEHTSKTFADYTAGWDWARGIQSDLEANEPDYDPDTVHIDVDSEWMSQDDWDSLKEND